MSDQEEGGQAKKVRLEKTEKEEGSAVDDTEEMPKKKKEKAKVEVSKETMTPRQRQLRNEEAEIRKKVEELKGAGDMDGAIALVTKFEKKTRLALEFDICADAATLLVQLFQEKDDMKSLNAAIITITKHRQQHRKVIAALMKESMKYLEAKKFADEKDYLEYLDTLRTVSAGKIYLEVEAARLTMRLAKHKEADGDVEGATKVLLEVAVETYGTMDKYEKAEFLLEQIRLTLKNKDFIRASIVAKKVDRKVIRADDFQDIKLKYYQLMLEFYLHKNDTLQLCECFLEVLHTPKILAEDIRWKTTLANACLFLALSTYGYSQQQLLTRVHTQERARLEKMPAYDTLIKQLVTDEIIPWPLAGTDLFMKFLKQEYGEKYPGKCEEWLKTLELRVTEKNIRVVAKCYSRIRIARLGALLGKSTDKVERILSDMVCVADGITQPLYARIDRPAGIISFRRAQVAETVLTEWTYDIGSMMQLVERTKHLIDREIMVNNAK